ncbi:MAG: hypothetical protein J6A54_00880 [Clostridia bacterium]|nr:hypothetical protein [Clostridia bacterium]
MKRIGMIRGLDNLGRLVIPKEMRKMFRLEKEVEMVITEEGILLRSPKYVLVERKIKKQAD